ncbi:cytosine permease (plasmid) [Salipiger sp. H15]|uniref:Cytosine permease n=1 Tax=Alloyangia sp. H15 TaxID=3029062 RepID=A0AAU8ASD7_9RHOB
MADTEMRPEASRLETLTEDYTREPVPAHVNTRGLQIAIIQCAIGITLPVLAYSSWLAQENGLGSANFGFWAGSWIVALISVFSGMVGAQSRLSTYMILQFSFGRTGAKLVNLLMAVILLGWYAVTCEEFGLAISQALETMLGIDLNVQLATLAGSVLMALTTIFGFQMIEKFSRFSVPLLAGFMVYVALQATGSGDVALDWSRSATAEAEVSLISTVIGLFVIAAVLMPDFTRFCPNSRESIIASVVGLGFTFPMVALLAAIPAVRTGESDLIMIMAGMGVVFAALFVLVFATWSTNITNLYSSTLTLSTIATKVPSWKLTVLGAVVATAAAMGGLAGEFTTFLLFIGVTTTPLVGIYVVDFFLIRGRDYDLRRLEAAPAIGWPALVSWALGSTLGYLTENGLLSLTGLSAIDALIPTALLYFVLAKLLGRRA